MVDLYGPSTLGHFYIHLKGTYLLFDTVLVSFAVTLSFGLIKTKTALVTTSGPGLPLRSVRSGAVQDSRITAVIDVLTTKGAGSRYVHLDGSEDGDGGQDGTIPSIKHVYFRKDSIGDNVADLVFSKSLSTQVRLPPESSSCPPRSSQSKAVTSQVPRYPLPARLLSYQNPVSAVLAAWPSLKCGGSRGGNH